MKHFKTAFITLSFSVLFMLNSCGSGSSGSSNGGTTTKSLITLTIPSSTETNLAEKRDFYVFGTFAPEVKVPGNIKVELYKLPNTVIPIRLILSHVDETGTTPLSAIRQNNPEGYNAVGYAEKKKPLLVPDLIQEPGGFLNPNNKALVTPTGFSAIILGGVTKDFDTNYTDMLGKPLQDLTEGTYKLVVTGLSGDITGSVSTMQITYSKNKNQLGRFITGEVQDRLKAYAVANHLRTYFDPFVGFFTDDSYATSFNIPRRWSAQNSIEIVNTLPGIINSNLSDSENHVLIYAVASYNLTHTIEIGAIVANGLTETAKTFWLHYDMGEPSFNYVKPDASTATVNGNIVPFNPGSICELTRLETEASSSLSQNNVWYSTDQTPKTVIPFVSSAVPVVLSSSEMLEVFGACRPIPSAAIPGEGANKYFYTIPNQVQTIHYTITGPLGVLVDDETLPVALQRFYGTSTRATNSMYEFKHDFHFNSGSGNYQMNWEGIDAFGNVVPGAQSSIKVTVQ